MKIKIEANILAAPLILEGDWEDVSKAMHALAWSEMFGIKLDRRPFGSGLCLRDDHTGRIIPWGRPLEVGESVTLIRLRSSLLRGVPKELQETRALSGAFMATNITGEGVTRADDEIRSTFFSQEEIQAAYQEAGLAGAASSPPPAGSPHADGMEGWGLLSTLAYPKERDAMRRALGDALDRRMAKAKKEAGEPARVVWGWTEDLFCEEGYHGPFNSQAEAEASCRANAAADPEYPDVEGEPGCIGYIASGKLVADVLREAVKRISADEIVAAVNDAAHEDVDWDGDLFTTRDTPCWPGQREELFRFLLPWAQKNLVALDGLTWIITEEKGVKIMREP